jgi:GDP-mannose 6-dehydrogenase
VIGLGYVGLTSFLGFHKLGGDVIGCDSSELTISALKSGTTSIHDKGMADYLQQNCSTLKLTNNIEDLRCCDEVLICVPTNSPGGKLDLSILRSVVKKSISLGIKNILIRSTIDTPDAINGLSKQNVKRILLFPEFLREGKCWEDFFDPALCVFGGEGVSDTLSYQLMNKKIQKQVNVCTFNEAIVLKLACNAFHALKVVFANDLRNISWSSSVDFNTIMKIFSDDKKLNLSASYLQPGLPFGGPCLPKDTSALAANIATFSNQDSLFDSINAINEDHKSIWTKKLEALPSNRDGIRGLEFKAGSGDLRNSPIIDIILMLKHKSRVRLLRESHNHWPETLNKFKVFRDLNSFENDCDIIVSYTHNSQEKYITWENLYESI